MKRLKPSPDIRTSLGAATLEEPTPRPSEAAASPAPPSRVVARNVTATMITQVFTWALSLAVIAYVPGYLHDRGFGLLSLVGTYSAIFAMFSDLGTGTVLIKELARDRNRVGDMVSSAIAMRVPLAIAAAAIGMGAAYLLRYSVATQELIAIGLGIMVLGQFSGVIGSALYGLERIGKQNIASVTDKLLLSALMIALVIHRAPLWQFVAIGMLTGIASLGVSLYFFRDYLRQLSWPRLATMRYLVVSGVPFITAGIFNSIYIKIDPLMMSKISSLAAVGWYSIGAKLAGTCLFIPVSLCSAMLPTASRIYHEDPVSFASAMRRTFNLILICVVPFSAVLILAPDVIVAFLYPPEYSHAVPVLRVWGFALILYFVSQVASMALMASDRQWITSRVFGVAAVFSVPLTAACIYVAQRYWANGAVGAIVSDVLAEVYIAGSYIRALPSGAINWGSVTVLGRAVLAALPTIGLLHFLVHSARELFYIVPGILLYLPLCWAMGCLHPQDVRLLRQLLRRQPA